MNNRNHQFLREAPVFLWVAVNQRAKYVVLKQTFFLRPWCEAVFCFSHTGEVEALIVFGTELPNQYASVLGLQGTSISSAHHTAHLTSLFRILRF